jgi:hypothetical protein
MNKLSIMAKIRTAFALRNLLATLIGAIKGGAIPFGTFVLFHLEMNNDPWQPKGFIVLGGLAYSAKTVYGWCKQVFRKEDGAPDTLKALGWTVGIEGFMTCSSTFWLNCAALALLILVNAVATGVSLAMEDEASKAVEGPRQDVEAEIAAARDEIVRLQSELSQVSRPVSDVVPAPAAVTVRRKKTAVKRTKAARMLKEDATVN